MKHIDALHERHRNFDDRSTVMIFEALLLIARELHQLHNPTLPTPELSFNLGFGPVSNKVTSVRTMDIKLTNEQKVLVWLQPVTGKGHPVKLDGAPAWAVTAGSCTIKPADDGMSCTIISGDDAGDSEITVNADADLGAGVRTLSDAIRVTVAGAEAQSLGMGVGEPTDKDDPAVPVTPVPVPAVPTP